MQIENLSYNINFLVNNYSCSTCNKSEFSPAANNQTPAAKVTNQDKVEISQEAQKAYAASKKEEKYSSKSISSQLTEEDKKRVEEFKKTDQHVKNHEMAHKIAGGASCGPAIYEYETGPDGKKYAVAGHVSIDLSEEKTPEQTLIKAQTAKRAALAPSDPSPQDRQVAAQAQQMATEAQKEIAQEKQDNPSDNQNMDSKESIKKIEEPKLNMKFYPDDSNSFQGAPKDSKGNIPITEIPKQI